MKLASVIVGGAIRPAILEDGRVLPLSAADGFDSVKRMVGAPRIASRLKQAAERAKASDWIAETDAVFAPPIPDPGKFICFGLNYRDHAAEGGHAIPEYPALFMRVPTSIVGHNQPLIRPLVSDRFDYEAELMIVIGSRCRHATEANALDAVYGYTLFNDGSIRDYQRKSGQWTAGKNFDATGSVGPAIVPKEELPAGAAGLRITCRVNGETLQDGNTGDMIFPTARAIAILSEIMTLEPGDLIAMGTPAGVGFARKPAVWLKAGDTCEVEIEGIGRLVNRVVDEPTDKEAARRG